MKTNFSKSQVEWASQHDWYISGSESQIVGRATEYPSDDERHYATFTNFKQLRDWAGY